MALRRVRTKEDLAKKRAWDRRARERCVIMFDSLRQTRDELEYATLVMSTLGDDDAVWDDFIDDKTMRLRKLLRLVHEAATLERERVEIRRLLDEQKMASRAIEELMEVATHDDWSCTVQRLRDLARIHYEPWTMEDCQTEISAALKEINAFAWGQDKVSSGLSFFGWREARRVDPVRGEFQFEFTKTFKGYDILDYVNVGWDTYTDAKIFRDIFLNNRLDCTFELLQQLGPNLVIMRGTQRYPALMMDVHLCYLVYRVRTEGGVFQFVRSISSPAMQKAIDGPKNTWASIFMWFRWEHLPSGEHGYTLRTGGTVGSEDPTYVHQWMLEGLASLLRSERLATDRRLIRSE